MYIQVTIDVFIILCLIIVTGGIESWFLTFLPINVIGAGILLGKQAGLVIAYISSIAYGATIELQFYKIIPVPYNESLGTEDFFYNILTNIIATLLIAYFSRYLIIREESTYRELEKTENEFRNLYALHRDVIESIPNGLFYTDFRGRIMFLNRSAEIITGIERSRIIEMNLSELFNFIDLPLKEGRHNGTIEIGGELRKFIDISISSHRDNYDRAKGFVITFQDITKITEMERRIKEKEKLAAIGELSSNIAHEIRNPLASLRSSVELLREGRAGEDNKKRLMDIAIKETERLDKIITDFLLYSTPRLPDFAEIELGGVLEETIEMLKSSLPKGVGEISVKTDIEDGIVIDGDTDKLKQIFWNLALNAVQSIDSCGEVRISLKKEVPYVKILIADNGTGISRENLQKIFYPFFTTKNKGTGLGLAMVYRIVEDHSGTINVMSKEGEGTTFELILPVKQEVIV